MAGDGRRAHVEGHSEGEIAEAGPDPDQIPVMADRHRHRPVPLSQDRLQLVKDRRVYHQSAEIPLLLEGIEETLQIAGRAGQVGLGDLDVMKADDRIDGEGSHTGPLPHHLTMDLAVGRHVDDDVVDDVRSTAQTVALAQRSPALIVDLGGAGCGEPVGTGLDPGPAPDDHLTSAADPSTPAHRVEVDSKGPGRVEDGGARRETPLVAPTG